jgi:hypothetical protein
MYLLAASDCHLPISFTFSYGIPLLIAFVAPPILNECDFTLVMLLSTISTAICSTLLNWNRDRSVMSTWRNSGPGWNPLFSTKCLMPCTGHSFSLALPSSMIVDGFPVWSIFEKRIMTLILLVLNAISEICNTLLLGPFLFAHTSSPIRNSPKKARRNILMNSYFIWRRTNMRQYINQLCQQVSGYGLSGIRGPVSLFTPFSRDFTWKDLHGSCHPITLCQLAIAHT